MNKLERKLFKLGYEITKVEYFNKKSICTTYEKNFEHCYIRAWNYQKHFKSLSKPYHLCIKYNNDCFSKQEVIDNLQLAFNEMQKDLKELEQCQN